MGSEQKKKKERKGLGQVLHDDFIFIVLILLLLLCILVMSYSAGDEIEKIRLSYENFIDQECVCEVLQSMNIPDYLIDQEVINEIKN